MNYYSYIYPGNKIIKVSEETTNTTPITFSKDGRYFEPDSIEYFFSLVEKKNIKGTKNIVDVGAQSGLYSLFAKHLTNSTIYAFEPNTITNSLLESNMNLNEITNLNIIKKGVGKEESQLALHVPIYSEEQGLCCFGDTPKRFSKWIDISVDITTLDKEFYEKDIPVHFIKCDTEGWELNVLKGGIKTLKRWSPELFFEVNETNLNQCGTTKEELLNFLNDIGYTLITIKDNENHHFTKKPKQIRLLNQHDYKEYFPLIDEYRTTSFTENEFIKYIEDLPSNMDIWVMEHENKLVATATIMYEPKLIINRCIFAHVEDMYILKEYKNEEIQQMLLEHIMNEAKQKKCYKIKLTCKEGSAQFYLKNNFERRDVECSMFYEV